jgi:hypothetical protein
MVEALLLLMVAEALPAAPVQEVHPADLLLLVQEEAQHPEDLLLLVQGDHHPEDLLLVQEVILHVVVLPAEDKIKIMAAPTMVGMTIAITMEKEVV